MSTASEKAKEWSKRQQRNRKYRNQNCVKFGERTIDIRKRRMKTRKDAHERYLNTRYHQQIRDYGKVFILELDTKQVKLDET